MILNMKKAIQQYCIAYTLDNQKSEISLFLVYVLILSS